MTYAKCKGLCSNQKFRDQFVATRADYPEGWYGYGCGRCTGCELFFVPGIQKCPCCGRMIRARPRLTKDRVKYVETEVVRY